jgi:hypothetical protein
MKTLDQLFQQEIGALIIAKRKFVEALKLLNESISDETMKERVTAHLLDTLNHVQALQNQFRARSSAYFLDHELSDETDIQETYEKLVGALVDQKPSFPSSGQPDSKEFNLAGLRRVYE